MLYLLSLMANILRRPVSARLRLSIFANNLSYSHPAWPNSTLAHVQKITHLPSTASGPVSAVPFLLFTFATLNIFLLLLLHMPWTSSPVSVKALPSAFVFYLQFDSIWNRVTASEHNHKQRHFVTRHLSPHYTFVCLGSWGVVFFFSANVIDQWHTFLLFTLLHSNWPLLRTHARLH